MSKQEIALRIAANEKFDTLKKTRAAYEKLDDELNKIHEQVQLAKSLYVEAQKQYLEAQRELSRYTSSMAKVEAQ